MTTASTLRLTAQDFDQELLILFDAYVHGGISRRGFLDGAQKFATASMSAAGLLAALSPNFARAQVVPANDARLTTQYLNYDSPNGTGSVKGYLARPASAGRAKLPTILVVHENRGLNPHIEDIVRRLALDGYMAFAPDALTPLGGYPKSAENSEDKARELFAKLDQKKTAEDFVTAVDWLSKRDDTTGKIGVTGFCYGGGVAHMLAVRVPSLAASVPFYGNHPAAAGASKVKTPLLIQFAGIDDRINAAWPAYEAALKAASVPHTAYVYAGVQHGFNNDTTPRFDAAAAKLAWQRTMAFFDKHVKNT
jgi:carboxymethylenebutenolidase